MLAFCSTVWGWKMPSGHVAEGDANLKAAAIHRDCLFIFSTTTPAQQLYLNYLLKVALLQ